LARLGVAVRAEFSWLGDSGMTGTDFFEVLIKTDVSGNVSKFSNSEDEESITESINSEVGVNVIESINMVIGFKDLS
jgi:hypothetical protein